MQTIVLAFIGAFAAVMCIAEIQAGSKVLKYLAAFVVGLVASVVLWAVFTWVAGHFPHP